MWYLDLHNISDHNSIWKPVGSKEDDETSTYISTLSGFQTHVPISSASSRHLRLKIQESSTNDTERVDTQEIWILLTRHVVDTSRDSEFISLRGEVEEDVISPAAVEKMASNVSNSFPLDYHH
jgi:hypothetical protein